MIELDFSREFRADVERLTEFLLTRYPEDAVSLGEIIVESLQILTHSPDVGRPYRLPIRELIISRGKSGYLVLYRFKPQLNQIQLLRIRHQRESGYKSTR